MKHEEFLATIWLGLVQTLNAILPLLFFYTWRRSVVSFDSFNSFYDKTWQILVWTHLGLNGLPALLWPFTYLDQIIDSKVLSIIRHFYWYTLFACGFVLFNLTALWNTTAFILSATYYFNSSVGSQLQQWVPWLEASLYLLIEVLVVDFWGTLSQLEKGYRYYNIDQEVGSGL